MLQMDPDGRSMSYGEPSIADYLDQNSGAVDPAKIEMAVAELDMITDVL